MVSGPILEACDSFSEDEELIFRFPGLKPGDNFEKVKYRVLNNMIMGRSANHLRDGETTW